MSKQNRANRLRKLRAKARRPVRDPYEGDGAKAVRLRRMVELHWALFQAAEMPLDQMVPPDSLILDETRHGLGMMFVKKDVVSDVMRRLQAQGLTKGELVDAFRDLDKNGITLYTTHSQPLPIEELLLGDFIGRF